MKGAQVVKRRKRLLVRVGGISAATLFLLSGPATSVHGATTGSGSGTSTSASTTATSGSTVSLIGEGSYDPMGEIVGWQNGLYGSDGDLSFTYLQTGGQKGRVDVLTGNAAFAISGTSYTAADFAQADNNSTAASVIAAPVLATGTGVLVLPPAISQVPGYGFGETTYDSDGNATGFTPYTGHLNLPPNILAGMLFAAGGTWDDPSVAQAFGLPASTTNPDGSSTQFTPTGIDNFPGSYLQSEASEQDYYAQEYAATAAPSVWAKVTAANKGAVPADQLPATISAVHTTQGILNALGQETLANLPAVNDTSAPAGGLVTPVPASGLLQQQALSKAQKPPGVTQPQWAWVLNEKGQYEAPSPTSIDASVDAGGDTPMYALTHNVDGGYPLAYVDNLYAPAKGLSIDKTEAVATIIRYLATDGQGITAANNDGQLSATLVDEALTAANKVVSSNCAAAGGTVVSSSDPGRFAPSTPELKKIGSMLHCAAPASGTGPASSTDSGGAGAAVDTGLISPVSDSSATADGGASAAGSSVAAGGATGSGKAEGKSKNGKKGGGDSGAITLTDLPSPLPYSGSPTYDILGAVLLGAGLFFTGRRIVAWLIRLCQG